MATARLGESDWLYLIPRLPLTARGFLRHRRDLPFSARQVLERLGVKDLVLPEPELDGSPGFMFPTTEERRVVAEPELEDQAGIGALVRRIEAFQRARREGGTAPRLPLAAPFGLRAEKDPGLEGGRVIAGVGKGGFVGALCAHRTG